jgi:hypothetical protein
MIAGVRLLRLVAALLVLAIAPGPALLDGCLVSCHAAQSDQSSGTPSCHEAVAPAPTPAVRGVSTCAHDHDGIWADAPVDFRASYAHAVAWTLPAADPLLDRPAQAHARHGALSTAALRIPASFGVQLRI